MYVGLETIFKLVSTVPNVIWSGLIASVLTLSGVLISNHSNTKRLLVQLQHDSKEKAKERAAVLRREVYLLAAEELTKLNSYLGTLAQADFAKVNVAEGFQNFFAVAAKLQLVAEPKAALLANQLVGFYGQLLLRMMEGLMPLQEVKRDIVLNDEFYNKAQSEVSRVLSEMARFNESAQVNELVFSALQRSFDLYQDQAKHYADARSAAWNKFNKQHIQFSRQLLIELREIGKHQIPLVIEIRRDLGLITDIEEMKKQMETQVNRVSEQLNEMLERLEAELTEQD